MLEKFNSYHFAGQELWRLFAFFAVILVSLIVGKLARFFIGRAAQSYSIVKGNKELILVTLKAISRPIILVVLVLGVRVGCLILLLGDKLQAFLSTVTSVLNAVAVGYLVCSLVDIVDHYLKLWAGRTDSKVDDALAPLVGRSIRITVTVLVVLNVAVVISGKDMTTILASLGVGGLAIALAGQDTIKNFFGSLVIFADKPFEIGERIVVDGFDGPVESVGFRSTKIRTLNGHLVTIPNSEMVNRMVENIGRRPYIRRLANITITYDTPPEKVIRAKQIIEDILKDHDGMDQNFPPRVFFNDFNDCSLNIIMLYWYHPPDYWKYLEFSEKVNMAILSRFNEDGIEFAFPSQTVYLHK